MLMRPRHWLGVASTLALCPAIGLLLAPPPPVTVAALGAPATRGVLHVHTTRSDGGGSVETVVAAAAAAGLDFVVLSDHGDGTRDPDPPAYVSGVLVIDAVEISSDGGHVVALDAPASPYPLGGEARDVVEDLQRMGAMTVAAHPGSPVGALAWTDWAVPIDGLEWINGDSAWRDDSPLSLGKALLSYPWRATGALARLFERPEALLARWDQLLATRRVVAMAAADAHGQIELGWGADGGRLVLPGVPSYKSVLGLASVGLDGVALTGDADEDARLVLEAVRSGQIFTTIDALAGPGSLHLEARNEGATFGVGDFIPLQGELEIVVRVASPPEARIDLFRAGEIVASGPGPELLHLHFGGPAFYRAEVALPWAPGEPPVPWLLSNPLYVGRIDRESPPSPFLTDAAPALAAEEWAVESSTDAEGAIDAVTAPDGGPEVLLRFALSGRASESPFVAFRVPVDGRFTGLEDGLAFSVRADRPLRVDVQIRTPTPLPGDADTALGERWHRSVYADAAARDVVIPLDDLRPRGPTNEKLPDPSAIDSLLFVIDTVNTPVGTGGRIYISDLRFGPTQQGTQ